MVRQKTTLAMAAAVALCTAPLSAAGPAGSGHGRDVIIEWNQLLQQTMPGTLGIQAPRYLAMLHIAMFDAANSVEGEFEPYRYGVRHAQSASAEAAAAQAAHDVLVALVPASADLYDAALAARLATLPHGRAVWGVAVGQKVAAEILAWRQQDGWTAPEPGYSEPPFPGLWQLTPGSTTVGFTRVPAVTPFALLTATQYLPPPPPALTSARYAEDFNEVLEVGRNTSSVRTADQTLVARLWAGGATVTRTTLFALWNNVARDAAAARGLSLVRTARLFAFLNVAIHDGLLTTMSSKFVYGLWRPVTAIARADEDLNDGTMPVPGWLPLLTTPPYPAYAGNQACVGASAATVLARIIGKEIPFTIVWRTPDDTANAGVRSYTSFWQAAQEQERSRVWGGIHYSFDGEVSQQVCPKVAEFALANYARPKE